jgi:hypothetical protein
MKKEWRRMTMQFCSTIKESRGVILATLATLDSFAATARATTVVLLPASETSELEDDRKMLYQLGLHISTEFEKNNFSRGYIIFYIF